MSSEVVLYGRESCHLCEEARAAVLELLVRVDGAVLREVDIDSDDELLRRYLERIPVIEVNGRVVSELVPDTEALATALLHTSRR